MNKENKDVTEKTTDIEINHVKKQLFGKDEPFYTVMFGLLKQINELEHEYIEKRYNYSYKKNKLLSTAKWDELFDSKPTAKEKEAYVKAETVKDWIPIEKLEKEIKNLWTTFDLMRQLYFNPQHRIPYNTEKNLK